MNHLANITKKELKELLTPGTIVSILIVVIMFAALGSAMSGETEDALHPKEIGIRYAGDPTDHIMYGSHDLGTVESLVYTAYGATYKVDDPATYAHFMKTSEFDTNEKVVAEMQNKGYSYAINIPDTFLTQVDSGISTKISTYYIFTAGGIFSSISSISSSALVSNMNTLLSVELTALATSPIEAPFLLAPLQSNETLTEIDGRIYTGVTPYEIDNAMMSQNMLIPIIVMIVIVMVGSVVISSMGNEKENKTLETLLTMPIRRTTIVSGKLLAAAIMGIVYGICYLAGMMMYSKGLMSGLTGSSANLADYGLTMDATDWLIMLVILFLSIFSALGICMILGAFTKNYKMAQTMTLPISGLAMIPMFVFMFASWDSMPLVGQILMFIIPFSHPMMGMNNLMFGNLALIAGGIVYLLAFDLLMILITVKIYNSDILITGLEQSKSFSKISKMFKKEGSENE